MRRVSISQEQVDEVAAGLLAGTPAGEPLDDRVATLVRLALSASVVVLDTVAIRADVAAALEAGWTPAQIHEILTLVSGLGMHTFFEATRVLDALAPSVEPSAEAGELWGRYVGDDPYWESMEEEVPGFLAALNRQSPEAFRAFFEYCAVPWRTRHVPAVAKELVSVAVDAQPAHRYLPGMRLHIRNALKLGAGHQQLLDVLRIAGGNGT